MNVVLAIRQTDARLALELLLSEEPGVSIVGAASETAGLLALTQTALPDLVVVEWTLPGRSLLDVLPEAQTLTDKLRFLVVGQDADEKQSALDAGAHAFVLIGDPPEHLLAAVRQVRIALYV
jgi:DNA-binding NarL/FixJ family response regulator